MNFESSFVDSKRRLPRLLAWNHGSCVVSSNFKSLHVSSYLVLVMGMVMMVVWVVVTVPIVMGTTDGGGGGAPTKGVKQPAAATCRGRRRPAATASAEPEAAVASSAATAASMIHEAGCGAKVSQGGGGRGRTSNPDPGVHQTGLHAARSHRNHCLSSSVFLLPLPPLPKVNSVVLLLVAFRGLISNIHIQWPPHWLLLSSFMQRREGGLRPRLPVDGRAGERAATCLDLPRIRAD